MGVFPAAFPQVFDVLVGLMNFPEGELSREHFPSSLFRATSPLNLAPTTGRGLGKVAGLFGVHMALRADLQPRRILVYTGVPLLLPVSSPGINDFGF